MSAQSKARLQTAALVSRAMMRFKLQCEIVELRSALEAEKAAHDAARALMLDAEAKRNDLLAALKKVAHGLSHSGLCSFDINNPCSCGHDDRSRLARAAIALAEGRS